MLKLFIFKTEFFEKINKIIKYLTYLYDEEKKKKSEKINIQKIKINRHNWQNKSFSSDKL